jgi:hypothetical protein
MPAGSRGLDYLELSMHWEFDSATGQWTWMGGAAKNFGRIRRHLRFVGNAGRCKCSTPTHRSVKLDGQPR